METIKVNMNPNPLDVQTIHASQNDGEARQWGFKLHNNGDVIDSSEVTDQMVFKAYKGGTEQILPENGSTPVTSPFKGDIRYTQGLLTDQEFTYRQSPTEEDGNAKITDIKGNTLAWNQLVQNGNFADTSGWVSGGNRGTLSANNNEISYTITGIGTSTELNRIQRGISFTQNHIYLLMFDFYALRNGTMRGILGGSTNVRGRQIPCVSGWNRYTDILTANSTNTTIQGSFSAQTDYSVGEVVKWRNFVLFDLTSMGLDSLTVEQFTSLFPLSYYDFNQGSLLSFNGNGIKTVGKNLFQNNAVNRTQLGITFTINDDKSITVNGTATGVAYITHEAGLSAPNIKKGESLILSGSLNLPQSNAYFQLVYKGVSTGTTYSFVSGNASSVSINATEDMALNGIYFNIRSGATVNNLTAYPMLRYADTDPTYEPYTSSTLSLPISTYFPNGMKSAGNVYDELTESKAITRIGMVDLGSLSWNYDPNSQVFRSSIIDDIKPSASSSAVGNVICDRYLTVNYSGLSNDKTLCLIWASSSAAKTIYIKDSSYNDATAFKTAMNGVYLYYELATPTETSFTTASLVTENTEIPLSNEDGVLIGKCTEELSAEPGFIDAKIKLSDSDGECYSNKIQLHVERSPQ